MKKITKKKSKYFSINKKELFIVGLIGTIIISFLESYFVWQIIEMVKNNPSSFANTSVINFTIWFGICLLIINALSFLAIIGICGGSDNKKS